MGFERLKKNKDFLRVYSKKQSFGCKNLVIYYIPNRENCSRVGLSVSKKVGNAVTRNRVKRYLREGLKNIKPIGQNMDIIFVAREVASENDFFEISRSIRYLFRKIGFQYEENE